MDKIIEYSFDYSKISSRISHWSSADQLVEHDKDAVWRSVSTDLIKEWIDSSSPSDQICSSCSESDEMPVISPHRIDIRRTSSQCRDDLSFARGHWRRGDLSTRCQCAIARTSVGLRIWYYFWQSFSLGVFNKVWIRTGFSQSGMVFSIHGRRSMAYLFWSVSCWRRFLFRETIANVEQWSQSWSRLPVRHSSSFSFFFSQP